MRYSMVIGKFTLTSSPFLATQVLHQIAQDYKDQFPQAADIIRDQFYVDDCLTGAEMLEEAVEKRTNLTELLTKPRMTLHKWRSNSPQLMATIPEELRETENLQIIPPPDQCHKALGVHWRTSTDTLHVAHQLWNRRRHPPNTIQGRKRDHSNYMASVMPWIWHTLE